MRQLRHRTWHRPRSLATILAAAFLPLAVLMPVTIVGATSAAAAPAAGYTATLIPTGQESWSVAVNPDTDTVYFGDLITDEVTVVNGATDAVTGTIALPAAAAPRGIAVDPVTDTVYVTVESSPPTVAVINGATSTLAATITLPAGSSPYGVAVDSSTDTVYVAEDGASAVAVIDGSTNAVTATVGTGTGSRPVHVAVDETTDVVWVADQAGNVLAISGASNAVTQTITLNGAIVEDVAADPATNTVYAATESGLAVIDGATGTVSTTIAVTAPLFAVAVDPSTGTVFASSYDGTGGSGTTWVIDETSNSIVDTIERGGVQIAADTQTGVAYAAPFNAQTNAAWVLTPSAANAWSPVIKGAATATFTAGTAGSFTFTGTALPPATYSETGQLPKGVTLSSAGTLSGTPAAGTGGVYPITITASNGIAPDYSKAFTLTVDEAPTVTMPAAVTLQVGMPASIPIQVTGYPAPTNLFLGIAPPQWLVLSQVSSGSWELSGTPPPGSGGEYEVAYQAINAAGVSAEATTAITAQEAPSFTSAAAATFGSDTSNGLEFTAHCFPACTFGGAGLPSGLSLTSSGVLSGDPPAGTYTFTITASNSLGTATQAFTLTVHQSVAVGAEAGQLLAEAPQFGPGPGFAVLGGLITAAPAVVGVPTPGASAPVAPLFIAPGSNGELWMYSVTAGWAPLGPSEALCIGSPAAVVTGRTLTVACEGLNQALYYNTATLPATGPPAFTGPWTSLGGILSAGPAVAPVGGVMTFFATGTNGQVFTRTTTTGYTATPWFCIGHLAAATDSSTGITTFACQGGDHTLWTATNSGTGWSAAHSLGGQIVDGPGIAAAGGTTEYFAEGLDGTVWQWAPATGWTSLLGGASGGVGAVALN